MESTLEKRLHTCPVHILDSRASVKKRDMFYPLEHLFL